MASSLQREKPSTHDYQIKPIHPFNSEKMTSKHLHFETSRLILRPWKETDAASLYKYAQDPMVGTKAGWPPHTSVENSLTIIRSVFSAPEIYAVVLKATQEPIGSIGLLLQENQKKKEAEIGYWIGKPYWGQGLIPEAVRCILQRGFTALNLQTIWGGYYEGNHQSCKVMEKCGFTYHHTEFDKISPLGDIRTEHFTRITSNEYLNNSFLSRIVKKQPHAQ